MKILVVDDHRMFADGLRFLLEQRNAAATLHYATDAEHAFSLLENNLSPDLILLDLKLPGISGFSVLRQLQARGIWAPVLIVSASQSLHDAQEALNQGALGFVPKSADGEQLFRAIETVLNGEIYLPEQWSLLLGTKPQTTALSGRHEQPCVSARQLEVLHLLAQGLANKTIADKLQLSENTVKVHLRETFKALGVNNRTACVREAQRIGII